MVRKAPSNPEIAGLLEDIASLLEIQHANPFKISAYRRGAKFVRSRPEPIAEIVFSGDGESLNALPNIGESLAAIIEEYVKTGKSQLLHRLQGQVTPEELFEHIPGIGKKLATRLVKALEVKSLEDLEQAAHDGRLGKIPGFGRRRVEALRLTLGGLLSGFARRRVQRDVPVSDHPPVQPGVEQLLEVDAEYRRKATANALKTIAPKRFNPKKVAWLPVLHTEKGDWSYTALYSNTARAHDLGKTRDWVVIFFEKNGYEGQATVVTETSGPMEGQRVVRGREAECSN